MDYSVFTVYLPIAAVQSCPSGQMILPFRCPPQIHLEDVGNVVVDCTSKSVSPALFISLYAESVDKTQLVTQVFYHKSSENYRRHF